MASTGGIAGLKSELKALRSEMVDNLAVQDRLTQSVEDYTEALSKASNPDEINKLTQSLEQTNLQLEAVVKNNEEISMAAGTVADRMSQVNEQAKIFAGGSKFEIAGNAIGDMGNKIASLDFSGAQESAKFLTTTIKGMNSGEVVSQFKGLMGTIGELSKSFVQMGLKLLANPLFLLVAIIGAVVAVIIMLKDKVKIIEQAFDMLMAPINAIIDGLKMFADYLGITSFAADEAASKHVAANAKKEKSYSETSDKVVDVLDKEIRMAKINGKDTVQLEIDKQRAIEKYAILKVNSLTSSIDEINAQMKRSTREQKKELQTQLDDLKSKLKDEKSIRDNSIFEIKAIKAEDAVKDKELEDKNDAEAAAKAKERSDKKKADAKAYAAERLRISREVKDLELADMEDGLKKDLAINQEKYKRQLEDLKLSGVARKEAIALYDMQKASADEKAYENEKKTQDDKDAKAKADAKKHDEDMLKLQDDYNKAYLARTSTDREKGLKEINDSYAEEERLLKEKNTNKLITEEQYLKALEELRKGNKDAMDKFNADQDAIEADKETNDKIAEIDKYKDKADKVLGFANGINSSLNAIDANRLADIQNTNSAENAELEAKKNAELSVVGLTAEQRTAIENNYKTQKYNNDVKANNASNEIQKKQFARDKALRIAGVVIDTAAGIAKAVAMGYPAGILPGIAAAVTGAAQLVAINGAKFQGEAGPSAPALSLGGLAPGGGGSNASGAATPAFNLFGNPNNFNNVGAPGTSTSTQNITVTAVVSESDITKAQTNVAKYQNSAEL